MTVSSNGSIEKGNHEDGHTSKSSPDSVNANSGTTPGANMKSSSTKRGRKPKASSPSNISLTNNYTNSSSSSSLPNFLSSMPTKDGQKMYTQSGPIMYSNNPTGTTGMQLPNGTKANSQQVMVPTSTVGTNSNYMFNNKPIYSGSTVVAAAGGPGP